MADRSVVYRLRAEIGQFRAQMAQASASSQKLANDLTAIDKEGEKTRRGLSTLGGAAGKVGLVAAAGLGAAIVKAANFDQAMSNVQAATHESAGAMEDLREAALQAGADTAFSASEAAAGVENLAKAGVSTQDILAGGLSGALDLAAAGNLDVATAAEAAATAMTQFGLSGEEVPHIADLLAAGAGKAQGEVTDLSMALNQSGLVAAQMGLSIEETTGSLAAFASAGLLGSDAGTSLKTMLLRLANPSQKSADLMAELGINAYDANGAFVGMEALAGQLTTAFEGKTQAERDSALATIFGSDAIRAANVLYSQGSAGIADWTNKVDDSGYAAETAATKLDNLKGDLEAFRGSLETALIGSGDGAQGPLRSIVQGATDAVNAFNNLPPAAQSTATGLLAITAITGGGLWFGSKVISGIANTRQALDDLGFTGSKTAGVLGKVGKAAGIAGLALAALSTVDAVQKNFKGLNTGLEGTTQQLLDLTAAGSGALSGEFSDVADSFDRLTDPNKAQAFQDSIYDTFGFLGSDSRVDKAKGQFEAIDAALANIVTTGSADKARDAFSSLALSLGVTGEEQKDLLELLPAYRDALTGVENDATLTAESQDKLTAAEKAVQKATARAAAQQERQAKALKESRKRANETAREFFGLGDSLDDAKVSLGEWLKQLEDQADALRNFRINAEKAAKKGLDEGLIASLQEAGPAGALRMRQLANATEEQIARANRAWKRGQAEVDNYTDAVGGAAAAGPVNTKVHVDAESAMSKLYQINRIKLDDKTIYVHTVQVGGGEGGADFVSGGQRRAFGGPVYGPGSATSDSVPAYLSNGEYVVKAAAVDKYGMAFFDSVNAMRFASGGAVGSSTVNHYGAGIDYDRLAAAVGRSQLYGDVYMQPHNYGEFQRQMLHDRQQASAGGVPM